MNFEIIGGFCNGNGWIGFHNFNLEKMFFIVKKPKAYMLMNLFIHLHLENMYYSNKCFDFIYFTFKELNTYIYEEFFSEKEFISSLKFLSKNGLIKVKKAADKKTKIIQFL